MNIDHVTAAEVDENYVQRQLGHTTVTMTGSATRQSKPHCVAGTVPGWFGVAAVEVLPKAASEAGVRRISMATRDELLDAVAFRYRSATRVEKGRILTEFTEISGYHRKHAERLLRRTHVADRARPRPERRVYDAAVREALVVLWEAADRICGKRLKPLIPLLIPAMERHGHLALDETVRGLLHQISAASIDRVLAPMRAASSGGRRRQNAHCSAVRRSVPVRTYADWNDPVPGYMEADLVAHSGPSASGSFLQTLTLTDVATGWTECAPLLFREGRLVGEAMTALRAALPFPLLGFDTDNDTVFMNEVIKGWCEARAVEFTRSRPYRKNDQASTLR